MPGRLHPYTPISVGRRAMSNVITVYGYNFNWNTQHPAAILSNQVFRAFPFQKPISSSFEKVGSSLLFVFTHIGLENYPLVFPWPLSRMRSSDWPQERGEAWEYCAALNRKLKTKLAAKIDLLFEPCLTSHENCSSYKTKRTVSATFLMWEIKLRIPKMNHKI